MKVAMEQNIYRSQHIIIDLCMFNSHLMCEPEELWKVQDIWRERETEKVTERQRERQRERDRERGRERQRVGGGCIIFL